MANIHFRERRLFALFSSTFVSLLTTMMMANHCGLVYGDFFTSLSQWETIIRVEDHFVRLLEEYIEKGDGKKERFKVLVKFLKDVKPQADEATLSPQRFVSHPVNSFLIIKRFTSDWLEMERILNDHSVNGTRSGLINTIDLHRPLFPTYEDLQGAIQGIFRLQETYDLTAHHIANGELSPSFPNSTLDTEDCFQIGLMAYHDQDYMRAKEWMKESLKRNNPKIYSSYLNRRILQEYIAWCEYETRNVGEALSVTKEILEEESTKTSKPSAKQIQHPNNNKAIANVKFFENVLNKKEYSTTSTSQKPKYDYMETYNRLCKGQSNKVSSEIGPSWSRVYCIFAQPANSNVLGKSAIRDLNNWSSKELAKLKCYYDTSSTPVLTIKPAKIEVLNIEPRIIKYKDFITDKQTEIVKELASPRLRRATINNLQTGHLEYANYRISKSAWIADGENETISHLSQSISSLTGLATTWPAAEEMQIANYGIGGHYEPHFDHATNDKASIFSQNNGNRIATFLIYLTDVESGGYTVFLNAEAIVKPTKGDAVFWYNLRRSGAGDSTTRHAACPVIVGSKWVSNKWIHAFGQEFHRKCGLSYEGLPGERVLYKQNL